MRPLRPHIQMVFQDPAESLNQRQSIGQIVAEPFVIHRMGTPPRAGMGARPAGSRRVAGQRY